VKPTPTVQVPPGATAVQVPVLLKSPALAPATVTPVTVSGAVPLLVRVTVCPVAGEPTATLPKDTEVGLTEAAGAMPLPDSATVSAAAAALEAMVSVPVRAPVAPGRKVRLTVQDPPGATVAAPPVAAKSAPFAPESITPETVSGTVPGLDTVTVLAAEVVATSWSPKSTDAGVAVICGSAPVPVSATVTATPAALLPIVRVAVRAPVAPGVKATLTVQVAPGATAAAQPAAVKSAAFAPPTVSPVMFSGLLPGLDTVTVWAAEVLPTSWSANVRAAGATAICACTPVPVSAIGAACTSAFDAMVRPAVFAPVVPGVKVTLTVQLPPGATDAAQPVAAKAAASVPSRVTAVTSSAAVPVLVTVTGCAAEVVPTPWLPKASAAGVTEIAWAIPVPDRFTTTEAAFTASEAMVSVAARAPEAAGVKPTVTSQLPPAGIAAPQPVAVKSVALAPPTVRPETVSGRVPVLDTVTVFAVAAVPVRWLPNATAVGVTLITGAFGTMPVPVSGTLPVNPLAASPAMVSVAVAAPPAVGVKVTEIGQLVPTAWLAQVVVAVNAAASGPVTVTPVTFSAAVPTLSTRTVWAAEVVPTSWPAKVRPAGFTVWYRVTGWVGSI
jgi:hypothetical protein